MVENWLERLDNLLQDGPLPEVEVMTPLSKWGAKTIFHGDTIHKREKHSYNQAFQDKNYVKYCLQNDGRHGGQFQDFVEFCKAAIEALEKETKTVTAEEIVIFKQPPPIKAPPGTPPLCPKQPPPAAPPPSKAPPEPFQAERPPAPLLTQLEKDVLMVKETVEHLQQCLIVQNAGADQVTADQMQVYTALAETRAQVQDLVKWCQYLEDMWNILKTRVSEIEAKVNQASEVPVEPQTHWMAMEADENSEL